jgi:hypothetical protein
VGVACAGCIEGIVARVACAPSGLAGRGRGAGRRGRRSRGHRRGRRLRLRSAGLAQPDQVRGHEPVEQLGRVEDAHAGGARDLLHVALPVDLRQQQPLHRVQVDLAFAVFEDHELRHELDRRDLLREHAPLVEPARGLHQQVGVALRDRLARRVDAGLETELARAPDREGVDRLFAREILVLGVDDPAFLEPDVAAVIAVDQAENAGLTADADELNDVGKVKLGERALKGHEFGVLAPLS